MLGHQCIPEIFAWGRSQYFEYMAMERLGQNLRDAVQEFRLTQRNLVILICQMVRPAYSYAPVNAKLMARATAADGCN